MSKRSDQLRTMRLEFERALGAGLTIQQLRRHEAESRWRAQDARLAARRSANAEEAGRELAWFQR